MSGQDGCQCAVGPAGPQGLQGLQGPSGPQGPQGIQGIQGSAGVVGMKGDVGPMGPQGPVGPSGLQGVAGLQGEPGPMGPIGLQGDVGPQGPVGAPGPMGPMGPVGPQGDVGPQGPMGLTGAQGDVGPQGVAGPQGPMGLTGPQGPMGPTGAQGPAGPAGVSGSTIVLVSDFGKLTPSAVSASSHLEPWVPSGVLSPGMSQAWLSATNSSVQEWIQFDLGSQVLLTSVFCSFANGRDGINPRVQVSNDGSNWAAAGNFVPADYGQVTVENFRNYRFSINLTNVYRYVRIISDPCPYLHYSFVQFFGAQ